MTEAVLEDQPMFLFVWSRFKRNISPIFSDVNDKDSRHTWKYKLEKRLQTANNLFMPPLRRAGKHLGVVSSNWQRANDNRKSRNFLGSSRVTWFSCFFQNERDLRQQNLQLFYFYSLYNVWKGQLYRISGSEFYEWLYGTKKFSGLSRNGLQRLWYKANNELFSTFCSEDPWVLLPLNNNDFFCSLLACSATMSSKGSSPLVYSHNKSVHIEGYMNVTMRKTIRMFFSNSLLIRRNKNGFLLVYEIKLMSEMKWFSIYYKLG